MDLGNSSRVISIQIRYSDLLLIKTNLDKDGKVDGGPLQSFWKPWPNVKFKEKYELLVDNSFTINLKI